MIVCADMKNVYNYASRAIKGTDCALHQCVRVIPVPARVLKLGIAVSEDFTKTSFFFEDFTKTSLFLCRVFVMCWMIFFFPLLRKVTSGT